MSFGARVAARLRSTARPTARRLASAAALEAYEPSSEHEARLLANAECVEDARPIRDLRATTSIGDLKQDLTVTTEGLEDMLGDLGRGARVLEVGPKYGIHSRWLDRALRPAELVFCDLPEERQLHDDWRSELTVSHRFVYAEVREGLVGLGPFDLVLFLGILYHSVYHVPMLAALNRVTRLGGSMLLETTIDPRPDASVWLRWHPRTGKAKAVPTVDAVRVMLAWTGWERVRRFTGYRPGSTEAVFLCEKTAELVEGTDFAATVAPHRVAPATPAASSTLA